MAAARPGLDLDEKRGEGEGEGGLTRFPGGPVRHRNSV